MNPRREEITTHVSAWRIAHHTVRRAAVWRSPVRTATHVMTRSVTDVPMPHAPDCPAELARCPSSRPRSRRGSHFRFPIKAAPSAPRGAVFMQPQALARGVRPPAGPRAARGCGGW